MPIPNWGDCLLCWWGSLDLVVMIVVDVYHLLGKLHQRSISASKTSISSSLAKKRRTWLRTVASRPISPWCRACPASIQCPLSRWRLTYFGLGNLKVSSHGQVQLPSSEPCGSFKLHWVACILGKYIPPPSLRSIPSSLANLISHLVCIRPSISSPVFFLVLSSYPCGSDSAMP